MTRRHAGQTLRAQVSHGDARHHHVGAAFETPGEKRIDWASRPDGKNSLEVDMTIEQNNMD